MAQTYTLDEAAHKLNLSVDEFKRRMQTEWKHVRPFRDGTTVRYRANEVDELARTYGLGSSDELPLAEGSPLDVPASPSPPKGKKPASDSDLILKLDDSDETFIVTPDQPKSVKKLKTGSDSDVKLEKGGKKKATADDEESILTEEFDAVGDR